MTEKASFDNLDLLISFVKNIAVKNKFSESEILDITLAAEEILVNIISYAYPNSTGDVKVSCDFDFQSKRLDIKFVDHGIDFDVMGVDIPLLDVPIEERQIGGMGIYLVRKVMDNMEYIRKNKQNILTISKIRNSCIT